MTPRHWFPFMLGYQVDLDMLECQLYEHAERVHKFILVEATVNHQGKPKPLWYADHKSRFDSYNDKIIHVIVDWLPTINESGDNWNREQTQRNAAAPAFMHLTEPDDIVIVADVDEIPSQAAMDAVPLPVLGLNLKLRCAALEWYGSPGVNGVLAKAGFAAETGIDRLRQNREGFPVFDGDGGWHFSWFGGKEAIRIKLESFCHLESYHAGMELIQNDSMYRLGMTWPGGDYGTPVEIDETYPRWVREGKCPAIWFRPRGDADLPEELR